MLPLYGIALALIFTSPLEAGQINFGAKKPSLKGYDFVGFSSFLKDNEKACIKDKKGLLRCTYEYHFQVVKAYKGAVKGPITVKVTGTKGQLFQDNYNFSGAWVLFGKWSNKNKKILSVKMDSETSSFPITRFKIKNWGKHIPKFQQFTEIDERQNLTKYDRRRILIKEAIQLKNISRDEALAALINKQGHFNKCIKEYKLDDKFNLQVYVDKNGKVSKTEVTSNILKTKLEPTIKNRYLALRKCFINIVGKMKFQVTSKASFIYQLEHGFKKARQGLYIERT